MNAQAQQTTHTSLASMRPQSQDHLPAVSMGFADSKSFELMQRAANLLSNSTLVPAAYRANDEKKGANPNALANCVVALNMAQRMGADPLMVMQNLYIVEGRPSWSAQWIIAAINGCGRFSPLRFDMKDLGEQEVEYTVVEWVNRERTYKKFKVKIQNMECTAWATEKETGERITSPAVSMEMAVKEGWYGKNGSKWQTMPEVMLRYRTASFFGKLYAPELLMGLQTAEEVHDIIDMRPDGTIAGMSSETLRKDMREAEVTEASSSGTTVIIDSETGEIHQQSNDAAASSSDPAKPIFDINVHSLKTQSGIKDAVHALCKVLEAYPQEDRGGIFLNSGGRDLLAAASRAGLGVLKEKIADIGISIPQE